MHSKGEIQFPLILLIPFRASLFLMLIHVYFKKRKQNSLLERMPSKSVKSPCILLVNYEWAIQYLNHSLEIKAGSNPFRSTANGLRELFLRTWVYEMMVKYIPCHTHTLTHLASQLVKRVFSAVLTPHWASCRWQHTRQVPCWSHLSLQKLLWVLKGEEDVLCIHTHTHTHQYTTVSGSK